MNLIGACILAYRRLIGSGDPRSITTAVYISPGVKESAICRHYSRVRVLSFGLIYWLLRFRLGERILLRSLLFFLSSEILMIVERLIFFSVCLWETTIIGVVTGQQEKFTFLNIIYLNKCTR